MLEIKNITKSFGGVAAVGGADFGVRRGQVTALIGPNGAGKTTLFDIISGLIRPDGGQVFFDGADMAGWPSHQRANRGISRTFQQVRLFKYLTIYDHLAMVENNEDTKFWKNIFSSHKTNQDKYRDVLEEFGIKREPGTPVSELSYGQRKLLQIAMALRHPHQLLMLDEPVAGVNQVIQEQIENLLLKLKGKGETILLIDHDMGFVRRLADRVVALDAGVVIADGTPEQVLNNPLVLEAYLGS